MKRIAAFLDRDGTINRDVDVIYDVKQLRLLPGAGRAIKRLNKAGLLVVIVTNQSVIARGLLDHDGLAKIHASLQERLARDGAHIDAIYYCPHHPDAQVVEYRINCQCRKPNAKMLKDAAKRFDIDLKRSFMVGDHTRDIMAGKNGGVKTILVKTGFGGKDAKHEVHPDFTVTNLPKAVDIIIKQIKKHAK